MGLSERVTTTIKMAITREMRQQDIENFYGIGREKAHKIWLDFLLFCDKRDKYIPSKPDFAAFINVDIREVLFYIVATKQDIIDMYENYLDTKNKVVKEIFSIAETTIPAIPSEMEIEVDYMLSRLHISKEEVKVKKTIIKN